MSVLQKLFHKKSNDKPFGVFCRKPRIKPPAVIELPSKDEKPRTETSVFVAAMPPPDLRLVLFQEETTDRKLLFDSKSFELQKVPNKRTRGCSLNGESYNTATNNGRGCHLSARQHQHVYVRGPQDSDILSEMLFGTVGMASRASSLKIHIMKNPQRVMLSRVFCVETAKETGSLERGLDNQKPASRRKAQTLPVPTPEQTHIPPTTPVQSFTSSFTSKLARSDSASSLVALTQLFGASLTTSGSLGSRSNPQQILTRGAHSLPPARQGSRDSFTLTQEPHSSLVSRRAKVKIGFAVIFQPEPTNISEFQRFFFEHFPLIESYVTFLKEQVEDALNNFKKGGRADFIEAMMEGLNVFTSRVHSIYSTPRLARPVWSTLSLHSSTQLPWKGDDVTIKCFISELARMVNQHNTKQKNFFMTGLVTSVLTHHLGWVNTMMPSSSAENSHPVTYNPLWAQLGDLYGAVGTPTKVAKTVVVGEIHELVSTIISILSYFIRYSNVKEVVKVPTDFTPQAFSGDFASLKMSYVESDLETSDYVLVDVDGKENEKSLNGVTENVPTTNQPIKREKLRFSFGRKNKNSDPIEVTAKTNNTSGGTPNGSALCRSRSSPGTSIKPQVNFNRQRSSGNLESIPPRVRTNSNDTFAKPRSVQSRRTSRETSKPQMSHSTSTLSIPDFEKPKFDIPIPSLEGDKVLDRSNPTTNATENTSVEKRLLPHTKARTHKRVSSEPFNVKDLMAGPPVSSSLVKTKSTFFPVVRQQTFVENIEPRVINVAHVQRANPIVAPSPNLPRNCKGPILGFDTNELDDETLNFRSKNKSGKFIMEKPKKLDFSDTIGSYSPKIAPKTAPENSEKTKFNFSTTGSQRSYSHGSTGSSTGTQNSFGKPKIATRRRRLTDSTKHPEEESDELEQVHQGHPQGHLPPLGRIPSISMKHDEFAEYFSEDEGKSEYIFFGAKTSETQSAVTEGNKPAPHTLSKVPQTANNQSTVKNNGQSAPPPIPTKPPSSVKKQSVTDDLSTVTESNKQKAENCSTVGRKLPPPLPSVGPTHKPPLGIPSGPQSTAKVPPPLPAAPPIHRGNLYPKLAEPSTVNAAVSAPRPGPALPKSSIYPSLTNGRQTPDDNKEGIYPKLDVNSSPVKSSLYPTLLEDSSPVVTPRPTQLPEELSITSEDISAKEVISLKEVEFSEETEKNLKDDEKVKKMTFGELLADYSPEYLWGFALHGTRNQTSLITNVMHELQHSISRPVLDEQIAEAVSIIADTDKWSVKVLSSHRLHSDKLALPALNSKLVMEILEKIKKLYQMNVPAAFCMQQLEQSLGELVLKSKMLAGYVTGNTRVKMSQLSAVLGIESSDLPLLMAIASCHSPEVATNFL